MAEQPRTPPARIRVTGLQEAQLLDLQRIDEACAAMYAEAGLAPSLGHPRTDAEIAALHRTHDLYVAEADHLVAGYLAWRDEEPKIGCVAVLNVHPDYQRFGVATRLLRHMAERCTDHEIAHVVARCWAEAPWAVRFLEARGFRPLEGEGLPEPVLGWRARQTAAAEPLAQPGERIWHRPAADLGVLVLPGIPRPD